MARASEAHPRTGLEQVSNAASPESVRGQLPFCLAPFRVALILPLACVARLAEIARISALRFAPLRIIYPMLIT